MGLVELGSDREYSRPTLADGGILGKHHVHDELGVQGVAGAGDIVDAGQVLAASGSETAAIDHRGLGVLGGDGGMTWAAGGGNGDDGVHAVGNSLIGRAASGCVWSF